jgi:myo-inositol 2-dehydrogenase / D-chiro-inositol 1-dehydrogenase
MKFALIGAGRIGRMHARILVATPGVEELLIADAVSDAARTVADEVGATFVETAEAAIERADAVVIAAATSAHASLVRAAIARRRAIFCEKPLAENLADTIAVAAEVEASGLPFQLGFQRRFDPGYREARRLIETGELGKIYVFRLAGHDPAPPHEGYIPQSGGLFRDFSIHDFDVIRWLLGSEVDEVYAAGAVRGFEVFAKYDDVDTAVATLRMSEGPLGVLTVARHDPLGYDIRAELFGSRDSVSVGLGPRTPLRSVEPGVPPPAGPAWPDFIERFGEAYRAEIVEFVRVARGEARSPCTARDGLQALRVAEAATRSRLENRPIALTEIPT